LPSRLKTHSAAISVGPPFASNLSLQWVEVPSDETGRVVRSMKLQAVSDTTGDTLSNFAFNDPALVGIITYGVGNGQIVAGTPQ